jgi:hypothetical protein
MTEAAPIVEAAAAPVVEAVMSSIPTGLISAVIILAATGLAAFALYMLIRQTQALGAANAENRIARQTDGELGHADTTAVEGITDAGVIAALRHGGL